jgi:hypothetical protein
LSSGSLKVNIGGAKSRRTGGQGEPQPGPITIRAGRGRAAVRRRHPVRRAPAVSNCGSASSAHPRRRACANGRSGSNGSGSTRRWSGRSSTCRSDRPAAVQRVGHGGGVEADLISMRTREGLIRASTPWSSPRSVASATFPYDGGRIWDLADACPRWQPRQPTDRRQKACDLRTT